ncbi:caldesmon-like [Strongylocentrotus purpuratus]|uniref:Uncharacterized protein n=1 Tax=Strongylocentrotus purpuratus TaxID=7668 RepID=A0A7M7PLU4_STRPU|nr:caldesmon-like [Strongylocentrotus purpuratus]
MSTNNPPMGGRPNMDKPKTPNRDINKLMLSECRGRVPLCALLSLGDISKARNELKRLGITGMYEIPYRDDMRSDKGQLQWLDLLRGCLHEGDRARYEKQMSSLVAEMTKKLESKQHHVDTLTEILEEKERYETTLTQQVEELKKGREDDRAKSEKDKRSLTADMTKKLESKQQHVDSLTEIVQEKERNETTLTQKVEELKKGREEDRTRAEKNKLLLAAEMTKKLESKQQHVDSLTEIVQEKERNETTLTQTVKELMTGREEDRAKAEKDKCLLAADVTKKLESKQQRVDTLTETVEEKGRNETTLRQQVQEQKKGREEDRARAEKDIRSIELSWKKEHDSKEQLLEQLEREIWKLRTKIQLESEIRSAEQKKKAETQQWSFIPWVTSGKQAQGGTSSFEDNSTGGLGRSDTLQAG